MNRSEVSFLAVNTCERRKIQKQNIKISTYSIYTVYRYAFIIHNHITMHHNTYNV